MIQVHGNGSVKFSFSGSAADNVFLVGDFNAWDEKAHPMHRTGGNQWEIDLKLRAGQYRFLYRTGALWFVDADAPDVPNPWGSEYSVVDIPETARENKSQPSA